MTWLLDGNALVALVLAGHMHHDVLLRWFTNTRSIRFATCVVTQGTLLRLHMTFAADRSAEAAWQTLAALTAHPRHEFWDDAFGYTSVPHRHLQGPRQVTDAWLAELARRRHCRLATLDSGLVAQHGDVAALIG
jgi:hypothetical protein